MSNYFWLIVYLLIPLGLFFFVLVYERTDEDFWEMIGVRARETGRDALKHKVIRRVASIILAGVVMSIFSYIVGNENASSIFFGSLVTALSISIFTALSGYYKGNL